MPACPSWWTHTTFSVRASCGVRARRRCTGQISCPHDCGVMCRRRKSGVTGRCPNGSPALHCANTRTGCCLASPRAWRSFGYATNDSMRIAEVEAGLPTRLNDGACDRQGRFVFGTLHEPPAGESRKAVGGLYRFNPDLSLQRLPLPGVAISNSIALSPDGKTLYYCDSPKRTIQCCDYGNEPGASRTFAELETAGGEPDGSSVDREGCPLECSMGAGSSIVRYTPDGHIDRVIDVPVSQPTRVAFGGRNLDTLYITSAHEGLDAAAMQRESMAGGLFSVDPGVQGLPEPRFAGPPAHVMATT